MALNEAGVGCGDLVTAELVECAPDPHAPIAPPASQQEPEAASPTQRAAEATEAQTGADPPPGGSRG